MKKRICRIVGAGENYGLDFTVCEGDFVIAADGGYQYLREKGIEPHLVIGDFDSLPQKPEHPNVVALNAEKDDTDVMAAVRAGLAKGYTDFRIYCATGGRIEHTLANIQLLTYLSQNGARGFLYDKNSVITAITNGAIAFDKRCKGYISVFSASNQSVGVSLKGLKYPLDNAVITNCFPIGVSNEFTGGESRVSVAEGTLIIILPRRFA